jgi:hypothetical protein
MVILAHLSGFSLKALRVKSWIKSILGSLNRRSVIVTLNSDLVTYVRLNSNRVTYARLNSDPVTYVHKTQL